MCCGSTVLFESKGDEVSRKRYRTEIPITYLIVEKEIVSVGGSGTFIEGIKSSTKVMFSDDINLSSSAKGIHFSEIQKLVTIMQRGIPMTVEVLHALRGLRWYLQGMKTNVKAREGNQDLVEPFVEAIV